MSASSQTVTILVVDDDPGLTRLMERSLRRGGHVAATAGSGLEATQWLKKNRADLMLLDLKLPDMEGPQLLQALNDAGLTVPFIIITGQGDERVAVQMMKRGALDYLVKDVNIIEFIPTVVRRALDQIERDRRLKEAEAEVLRAIEEEQRRIGFDLHDGLGQELTAIAMLNNVVQQGIKHKGLPEAETVARIGEMLRAATKQVRLIAHGLQPVAAEPGALMSSLRNLATQSVTARGVKGDFVCPEPIEVRAPDVANHFYRIAQEAVQNALRHGHPHQITVRLLHRDNRIILEVEDDGAGFAPEREGREGIGLNTMRYRADAMKGLLEVSKLATGGTLVRCSAPFPQGQVRGRD
jgi:signal transduction histidine kinase